MASSRVVLSPLGRGVVVGGLLALLIALLTLNVLLLLLPIAALTLVAAELVAFDRSTRNFDASWFRWQRLENSAEVPVDGVGSMAVDLTLVGPRPIYAELFDPQPDSFEVVSGSARLLSWWPAGATSRLTYVYRPRARGRFRIGPTVVVAHDPLGFGFRIAKIEDRWEVVVTPSLTVEEASAPFGSGVPMPSESFRRRLGLGTEFRSLREYQDSDDARRIAWRRSGIDKLYVREQEEESLPEFLVVIDNGQEMRLGPRGSECLEQAVDGGIVLAGQALRRMGRVGLLVAADRPGEYIDPQRGTSGAEILSRAFGRVKLSLTPTDLGVALYAARERLRAPTTVAVFSSLLTIPSPVDGAIAALRNEGHRVVAICPEVPSLYPTTDDPLADRLMRYAVGPTARRVDLEAERWRSAGAVVLRYAPSEIREIAATVPSWAVPSGGAV